MTSQELAPLHENPWFSIFLRDGYYTIEAKERQVAILPTVGRDLLMVKVFRPVVGLAVLEVPAGGVEAGETPQEGGRRELAEETGIRIEALARFLPLAPLSLCPDRMPEWPHLFRVEITEAEYAARGPFDHEIQELCRFTPEEALAEVEAGRILACLPLAMLFRHFLATLKGRV